MALMFFVYILSLAADQVLLNDKTLTLEVEGKCIFGNGITVSNARTFTEKYAKQSALEIAGTYFESNITALDQVVTKFEIMAFTGSLLNSVILEETKSKLGKNNALTIKIKAEINTELLAKKITEIKKDKTLEKLFEAGKHHNDELIKEITDLQKYVISKEESKILSDAVIAVEWYDKAYDSYFSEDINKAVADYNLAIMLDPKFALAYNSRGMVYREQKDDTKAISDFNKAIMLDPESAFAYNNRGRLHYDLHENNKAMTDYNKAIELDSEFAEVYLNRGIVHKEMMDYTNAIADFNKTIKLESKCTEALNNRGSLYTQIKDYKKALADLNKVILLDPQHADAYYNRGITYKEIKDFKKASSDLNEFLRLAGKSSVNADQVRQTIRDMGSVPNY